MRVLVLVLAALLCTPAVVFANPITTHPLRMALAGGFEFFAGEIFKGKAGNKEIINLAQGRDTDTSVPKNEILAVRIDCATGDATIVVWNTLTDSVIVTVSSTFSMTDDIATQEKNGEDVLSFSIGEFDVNSLGNATWGITDGSFGVAATVKYNDDSGSRCPSALKAVLIGTIDIVADGDAIDLLVIKGKAAAKSPVHIVP